MCVTKKSKDFCNCINDGSRPTAGVIQVKPANHSKVLYSKDMVLSIREKATWVVRCVLWRWKTIWTTYESIEKYKTSSKSKYGNLLWDKVYRKPDYWLDDGRYKGGMNIIWAFIRNVRTYGLMLREYIK